MPRHALFFRRPRPIKPEAPLFVFLPGMDGTGQLLRAQTEGLEQLFDIRCLAIAVDDLTGWDDLADQVIALVAEDVLHRPDRSVYLCGESFGGCLALKIVLRAPQLFERLILVNPASSFAQRPWVSWSSHLTRLLPEPMYQASCVGLLPFLASLGRIEAGDRYALLKAMQSVTQEASIWRLSLLQGFDVHEYQLRQITQPTLLVGSKADRLLPSVLEVQRLANYIPRTETHLLPDSGHACLLETEVNLYEIMRASGFLNFQEKASLLQQAS